MHHFNAIMQSRQVQTLSTSDTSSAIRGYTNMTDVPPLRKWRSFSEMWDSLMYLHLCDGTGVCQVVVGGSGSGKVWD